MSESIYALATAAGRSGVAIMRLSGPDALLIAQKLVAKPNLPKVGRSLRKLYHNGEMIDQALILTFDKNASFSGESVVEFHIHGSRAVIDALGFALSHYARAAEAGEFTRRALENGRLDLAQVEGLGDLLQAETQSQLKQAHHALSGAMATRVKDWRQGLIEAAGLIEASIDFSDEDMPDDLLARAKKMVARVIDALNAEIKGSFAAQSIRDGFEVAIIGPANIGKSTLFNALAGRDAAITSDIAGTTRDVIELRMNINGLSVIFLDTAGIRQSTEKIEKIGIERSKARAESADLRLFLTMDGIAAMPTKPDDIIAIAKADINQTQGFGLSGKTGAGVDSLLKRIATILAARASTASTATHERHRQAMQRSLEALQNADRLLKDRQKAELAAAELRRATQALSALIGAIGVEDILADIFSRFCIGK